MLQQHHRTMAKRGSGANTPDPKAARLDGGADDEDMFSSENLALLFQSQEFQDKLSETVSATVEASTGAAVAKHLPQAVKPLLQKHQAIMDKKLEEALAPLRTSMAETSEALKKLGEKLENDIASAPADRNLDDVVDRLSKLEASPGGINSLSTSPGGTTLATSPGAASSSNPWDRPLPRTLFTDQHLGPHEDNAFVRQVRAATAAPPTTGEFDRAVDHSIVKLSCKCMVARSEVEKLAKQILEDADITNTEFDIEGSVSAQSFSLRFKEPFQSALLHARKLLDAQRLGKAEWKRYSIATLEAGENGQPRLESLFVNPDKNNRQIKMEIATRKVIQSLKRAHQDKRFMCTNREEGIVGCEFRPICRIEVLSPSSVALRWNQAMVDRFSIAKSEVQAEFESDLGAGAGVQWS